MQYLKDKLLAIIFILLNISCSNNEHIKKIKINNFIVKANFIDGKIIDGKASYYDSLGTLVNITTYQKGIRTGVSVNYNSNGTVSDSVEFVCDKEHGYWRHYDTNGYNTYSNYYYYGLQYGPELLYKKRQLRRFLFSNFNRNVIAECRYDSLGNIDSIIQFKMNFILVDKLDGTKPIKNLFGYLPKLPNTKQLFSIGLTNENHVDKELFPVRGHNFYIDTLLPIPPAGWNYYLGCHLKANKDSINKFYIEEIIDR